VAGAAGAGGGGVTWHVGPLQRLEAIPGHAPHDVEDEAGHLETAALPGPEPDRAEEAPHPRRIGRAPGEGEIVHQGRDGRCKTGPLPPGVSMIAGPPI